MGVDADNVRLVKPIEIGIKCRNTHDLPFFSDKELEVLRINFTDKCIFNDLNDTVEDIIMRRYR